MSEKLGKRGGAALVGRECWRVGRTVRVKGEQALQKGSQRRGKVYRQMKEKMGAKKAISRKL